MPGELTRLLLQEERAIQPHEELVETVNLGTGLVETLRNSLDTLNVLYRMSMQKISQKLFS